MKDALGKLDMDQLRVFQTVYGHMSFSAAAAELDVNQSTISYAIGRLREVFSDPLFVRQGAGVDATERCHQIAAETSQIITRLETLARPASFDPATSQASVTISCNTYERLLFVPPLLRRTRRAAPGLALNFVTAFTAGNRQLLRGEADLVLSPVDVTESGIYSEKLLSEHYVSLVDRNNPLADTAMDTETYLGARHVVVHYGGAWRSPYLRALENEGHGLARAVSTPSPADLPNLVAETDLVATVPSRLTRFFDDRVRVLPCPFPAPFEIHTYWAARSDASPLVRWLRQLLSEGAGEIA